MQSESVLHVSSMAGNDADGALEEAADATTGALAVLDALVLAVVWT